MQKRAQQMGFILFTFLAFMTVPALADDIDAKIKRLEEIEARIEVKIRKLEEMEARLEARLQPVVAPGAQAVGRTADGMPGMPLGTPSTSVLGAAGASTRHESTNHLSLGPYVGINY